MKQRNTLIKIKKKENVFDGYFTKDEEVLIELLNQSMNINNVENGEISGTIDDMLLVSSIEQYDVIKKYCTSNFKWFELGLTDYLITNALDIVSDHFNIHVWLKTEKSGELGQILMLETV